MDGTVLVLVGAAVAIAVAGLVTFFINNSGPAQSYEEALAQRLKLTETVDDGRKRKDKQKKDKKKNRSATPQPKEQQNLNAALHLAGEQVPVGGAVPAVAKDSQDCQAPEANNTVTASAVTAKEPTPSAGSNSNVSYSGHANSGRFSSIQQQLHVSPASIQSQSQLQQQQQQQLQTHHDHVDFCEKKDIKVIDRLDEPPKIELHHKKQQQSPAKSSGGKSSAPTAMVAPLSIDNSNKISSHGDAVEKCDNMLQTDFVASGVVKSQQSPSKKSAGGNNKKGGSPSHEILATSSVGVITSNKKQQERKIFSKKELRELTNQIELNELPPDMGEDIVQRLVDALLNYQNESKEWKSTRQDPMQLLKNQMTDKENLISSLDSQLNSAMRQTKELQTELQTWKTRFHQSSVTLQSLESKQKDELSRMMTQNHRSQSHLEQQVKELQGLTEQLKTKNHQLETSNVELQSNLKSHEERVSQEKANMEQATSAQLDQTRSELAQAKAQIEANQTQIKAYASQIESSGARVVAVQRESEDLKSQLGAKDQTLVALTASHNDVQNRLTAKLSECETLSGSLEKARENIEQINRELGEARNSSGDVGRLAKEKAKLEEELAEARESIDQTVKKNWIAVEALTSSDAKYADLKEKTEQEMVKLRGGLLDALSSFAKKNAVGGNGSKGDSTVLIDDSVSNEVFIEKMSHYLLKQSTGVQNVQSELSSVKRTADDLRVKLDSVLEELSLSQAACEKLEKHLGEQVKESQELTGQLSASAVSSQTESAESEEKMEELADEIENLKKENEKLREDNVNYTTVLAQTEEMLQTLQNSVESEEKKWSEDRARSASDRKDLTDRIHEFEQKLRELQSQLEGVESEKSSILNELEHTKDLVQKLKHESLVRLQSSPEHLNGGSATPSHDSRTPSIANTPSAIKPICSNGSTANAGQSDVVSVELSVTQSVRLDQELQEQKQENASTAALPDSVTGTNGATAASGVNTDGHDNVGDSESCGPIDVIVATAIEDEVDSNSNSITQNASISSNGNGNTKNKSNKRKKAKKVS